MDSVNLEAEIRTQTGKIYAKKLRSQGLVPATIYGKNYEPKSLILNNKALRAAYKTNVLGKNAIVKLNIKDGEKSSTVEVISRVIETDAISAEVTHVDFLVIDDKTLVKAKVAVKYEGTPKGVKVGGKFESFYSILNIETVPKNIPPFIPVDISHLNIGDYIRIKHINVDKSITLLHPDNSPVAKVVATRKATDDDIEVAETPEAEETTASDK